MRTLIVLVFICILCVMCISDNPESAPITPEGDNQDQILVIHFHRINQCTCCINAGKWAEETVKLHFPEEYSQGTIVYMHVCIEENRDMATQYNVYGPSLYINVVKNGNSNITNAMQAWQHCHDYDTFVAVFTQMLEDALQEIGST